MSDALIFLGALAVAYTVPGPDMIFVLQTGATHGRARALAAAVGLAAARACHVAFAAIGLAAMFRAVPWVFDAVRLAGAGYLMWLGIGILRARSLVPERALDGNGNRRSEARAVVRGFLTNLLNPKPLIFCSVLLPQFVHPDAGPILWQFAWLGTVLVLVGLLFDAVFAVWGMALGRWLARRPAAQAGQRYGFAAVLIGFGADLAVMRMPQ